MKRTKFLALLLSAVMALSFSVVPAAAAFSDVPSNAWYASDVNDIQQYGILQGVGNNKFNPDGNMTLAEAITLACRTYAKIHNETIPNTNDNPWYWGYVQYANVKGICANAEFGTGYDKFCNRLTMAILFSRVLPTNTQREINSVTAIPDVMDNAENQGVYLLYRNGVLTGADEYGSFNPYSKISRAEAAAILNRVINPAKRKTFTLKELPSFVGVFNLVSWKEDGLEWGPWGTRYFLYEDGTGKIYEGDEIYDITYKTNGLKISVTGPEIDDVSGSLNGDVLTLSENDGRYTAKFARAGSKEEITIADQTYKEYKAWRPSDKYDQAIQQCIDYYYDQPGMYDAEYEYFTLDINGDGVKELFVTESEYPGMVLAAYTMQNGNAVCIAMADSPKMINDYSYEATLMFVTSGNYITKAYIDYYGNIKYTSYRLSGAKLVKVNVSRTENNIIPVQHYPY